MLKSLFNSKHSGSLSFLGGTALRYFYDLKRFSEDLDFDCFNLTRTLFFELTDEVNKELQTSGFNVIPEDKKKHEGLKAFRRVFIFPEQLKGALLSASVDRKLATRRIYDCEHMLFDKNEIRKIRTFDAYIENFNFGKFGP